MDSERIKTRSLYIDNVRLFLIVLVVTIHFSVTYSGIGSWYYSDTGELDVGSYVFFGLLQSFTQAYFMGFLFLISGYFTAKSYDKKGGKKYLTNRFKRLGIPTLLYMLIIHPFIIYVLIWNTVSRPPFLTYYKDYIFNLDFVGSSGPLWFAFALLLFDCFYTILRVSTKKKAVLSKKSLPSTKNFILLIVLISAATYLVRLVQPIDTSILNMQLCFFSQYILLFILGVKAGRYHWFSQIPYQAGRKWLLSGCILGLLMWFVLMVTGGALTSGFTAYKGGLTWQSAAYALWESFIAVSLSIGLLCIAKEKYNRQSPFIKFLSDNAFTVYVFHAPIIIFISMLISNFTFHILIKFLLACTIGIPLCFFLSHYLFRKIPYLQRIL